MHVLATFSSGIHILHKIPQDCGRDPAAVLQAPTAAVQAATAQANGANLLERMPEVHGHLLI